MPKLTRYLQKIFATNSNQVGVFGTGVDKETSKNVETLQSADYENGWSSAIITNKNYPIWQEMDGVQYGLSYQLKYLFQNGIPEWLSTETYYTNSYCRIGSTIYYSLQDNNTNHSPALQDGWWTPLLTSNRSIGEIIPSCVPLTEAGLHLLDGALITNGMYADFVTYIGNLVSTVPDIFCTEAQWQQSVTDYGVCGKFVYDSVNNTVRLPKITGIVEGTTDLTALGDLVQAGLPNITGTFRTDAGIDDPTGCFYWTDIGSTDGGGSVPGATYHLDASRSSSIYGNSNTVQPQTIKILYYIVIATSTKTDIQVDIDEIATDLNGKADVDLSNVPTSKGILTQSYINGASWYRIYSDGWCEQGGYQASGAESLITVTMLQTYTNTNYTLVAQISNTASTTSTAAAQYKFIGGVEKISGNQFKMMQSDFAREWYATGYIR